MSCKCSVCNVLNDRKQDSLNIEDTLTAWGNYFLNCLSFCAGHVQREIDVSEILVIMNKRKLYLPKRKAEKGETFFRYLLSIMVC